MRARDERAGWDSDRREECDELNGMITLAELRRAIRKLKRGKASGVDEWVHSANPAFAPTRCLGPPL
jgi:hypothetical protein